MAEKEEKTEASDATNQQQQRTTDQEHYFRLAQRPTSENDAQGDSEL